MCAVDASPSTAVELAALPRVLDEQFPGREAFAVGPTGTSYRVVSDGTPDRLLKVISAAAIPSPAEAARLRRDLQKQSELSVPSLGRVLEYGTEDSVMWVVREFAPGESLAARLRRPQHRNGLPLPAALAIGAQLSAALDELHRAGLLHRDLKAAHVIVEDDGEWPRIRLIDAGIAAQSAHLAPEVAAGEAPSFRSDLYALGCLLHQMLSGSVPDGRDFDIDWPKPLAVLLGSLLAHQASARPPSAQQARRTLGSLLPADAPAIVRGSWPAPSEARATRGGAQADQWTVPKFRMGVGAMADKTQEITLGDMEAADPQDPPTTELTPADIQAAVAAAKNPKAAEPTQELSSADLEGVVGSKKGNAAEPTQELRSVDLTPIASSKKGNAAEPTQELGSVDLTPIASSGRSPKTAEPTQELGPADLEAAIESAKDKKPVASSSTPPPAAQIRQRLSTRMSSPPPPPPESLLPAAQRRAGDSQRPAAAGKTDSSRPSKPSSRPAPPPAAYAVRTSGAPPTPGASGRPPAPSVPPKAGSPGVPAKSGVSLRSSAPSAAPSPTSAAPSRAPGAPPRASGKPDFSKTLAGTGTLVRPVAPVPGGNLAGTPGSGVSAPGASNGPSAPPSGGVLGAAPSGSAGRGILQPSAAEPATKKGYPSMSSRKATELGMPAVRPQSFGNTMPGAGSSAPRPSSASGLPAASAAALSGAGSSGARASTGVSSSGASASSGAGASSASALSGAGSSGVGASSGAVSSDVGSPLSAGLINAAPTPAPATSIGAPASSSSPTADAQAKPSGAAYAVAGVGGAKAAIEASKAADPVAERAEGASASDAPKSAADPLPPIPATAVTEPRSPSTPLKTAKPGGASGGFDVEALFDDKLEPEPPSISRPNDPTDPKTRLDDAAVDLRASSVPRATRSRAMQTWPLLAAAAVLGLVAITFSARSCGSSDTEVATTTGAAPHVLKPSAEPVPPPPAAPAQPRAEAKPAVTAAAEPAPQARPSAAPATPVAAAPPPAAPATAAPATAAPATAAPATAATAKAEPAPKAAEPAKSGAAVAANSAADSQTDVAGGKTLTAAQARPVPPSLRGSVVPYRANNDPQVDYKAKGRELFSAGKYKDAVDAYQHATQKTPSDAGAFAGLGASYLAAGQPDKAITAYQRALQLKPDVSGFQAALGRAYLQKGDRGRAASAYRKALELDPQNAAAKTGLQSAQ